MSTSNTHQQSLANASSETSPPMLEREDSYDDLFDYLQQFEKLVNSSSADPLALVAHTGSSSRTTSQYYVTHPSSVVDYDDDYQGDAVQNSFKDPLTSVMILLACFITQRFSNPMNNCLGSFSNTKHQAIVQGFRLNIQSINSGNDGRNTKRSYVQEEVIEGTNVQNDAGNIQRTLRTTSLGTATNFSMLQLHFFLQMGLTLILATLDGLDVGLLGDVIENDGVASKTTEESDEDVDEEEAKAFNLIAKSFHKFFRKNNQFGCGNRFGIGANRFKSGHGNSFRNKAGQSEAPEISAIDALGDAPARYQRASRLSIIKDSSNDFSKPFGPQSRLANT
uniref:Uncharacterized protein n=1 Tax=Tanacetum cinerariifolium TaxID=118510 RepID=A0A6L2LDW1_TANCI|nr:hypothetical protein [Tanacetum cinerariifolium]